MSPPQHVKAVSVACNAVVLIMGARNVFSPGTVLPIPGDDKFVAHFGGRVHVSNADLVDFHIFVCSESR